MTNDNTLHPFNRLRFEKSPYLLQHARNPVDWFPWGEEAFSKARRENKLIFLSIGYSTCHWCHVMEKETFEDLQAASLLNDFYVPIKVDREERPDIDHLYMSAVQAMTGSGGWPLTVFLTPDGKPVTGGTYFPLQDKWGRPGMLSILPRLAELWKSEPEKMRSSADELIQHLKKSTGAVSQIDYQDVMHRARHQYIQSFDSARGGFGGAPKFPRTHDLSYLLRIWKRTQDAHCLEMVETTLLHMACGGIYDHLGGGFARYSTDDQWLVPHFEKMLYDQASLAKTYLEAYQVTGKLFYAAVARDIFRYVLRDMTSPQGGFYSAEDADSEGEEGKFYVWTPKEMIQTLGEKDAAIFMSHYGVTESGNFEHAASVIHIAQPSAEAWGMDKYSGMRGKLYEARLGRIPPLKDDKILTAWNAMMISALCKGAQVLEDSAYLAAAKRAADFILSSLQKDGRLLRRWREGEAAYPAFLEDYAFLINALIDLYETSFESRYLWEAERLQTEMVNLFDDKESGGFFFSAAGSDELIVRTKEYYDGAVPSGNSMAALSSLRLSKILFNKSHERAFERVLNSASGLAGRHPLGFAQLLCALDFYNGPSDEVIITGQLGDAGFEKLLAPLRSVFAPNRVILYCPAPHRDERIDKIADFIRNCSLVSGKPAVYMCSDFACSLAITEPRELEKKLRES